jgi:hypothetical protein
VSLSQLHRTVETPFAGTSEMREMRDRKGYETATAGKKERVSTSCHLFGPRTPGQFSLTNRKPSIRNQWAEATGVLERMAS